MNDAPNPPTERLKLVQVAEGYHGPAITQLVGAADPARGTWMKRARGGSVLGITLPAADSGKDLPVVLKTHPISSPRRRVQALTGTSRGARAYRAGHKLLDAGVRTVEPIALLTGRDRGRPVETLVMQYVRGPTLLDVIRAAETTTRRERRAVAGAVGLQLRRLVDAGLYNRDHKPSNLIVTGPFDSQPVILDAVAIRPAPIRDRALRRMLTSLGTEPRGVGSPVGLRDAVRCASRAGASHTLLRDVIQAVSAKRDPRPRDNPLGAGS